MEAGLWFQWNLLLHVFINKTAYARKGSLAKVHQCFRHNTAKKIQVNSMADTYMKVMFGLVGGVVLIMLILLYVAYSYNQSNNHLKMKLPCMTDDDGGGERS